MTPAKRTLATLILLLNPNATPEGACAAVDAAWDRLGPMAGTGPKRAYRVPDSEHERRVLESIRSVAHAPSKAELYKLLGGNRVRMIRIVKQMIADGKLTVIGSGNKSGIQISEGC